MNTIIQQQKLASHAVNIAKNVYQIPSVILVKVQLIKLMEYVTKNAHLINIEILKIILAKDAILLVLLANLIQIIAV